MEYINLQYIADNNKIHGELGARKRQTSFNQIVFQIIV